MTKSARKTGATPKKQRKQRRSTNWIALLEHSKLQAERLQNVVNGLRAANYSLKTRLSYAEDFASRFAVVLDQNGERLDANPLVREDYTTLATFNGALIARYRDWVQSCRDHPTTLEQVAAYQSLTDGEGPATS